MKHFASLTNFISEYPVLIVLVGGLCLSDPLTPAAGAQRTTEPEREQNPYVRELNDWLESKHPVHLPDRPGGGQARNIADHVLKRAWGLTHSKSDIEETGLKTWHRKRVRKEIDYLLDVAEHYDGRLTEGGMWNVERFALRKFLDGLYRFQQHGLFSDTLNKWLERARLPVQWQYKNYRSIPNREKLPGWAARVAGDYPNSDAMYVLVMGAAGELYEEPRYLDRAHEFVGHLREKLLPAGGFHYRVRENEIATYHRIVLTSLARYWGITGDDAARELISDTLDYYPLAYGPWGVVEETPYPWYKRQMGADSSPVGMEIAARITGDGRNRYLAERLRRNAGPSVYGAAFRSNDVDPVRPADNVLRFDGNVNGLRLRSGRFSWVSTFGHGSGRDAFLGASVNDRSERGLSSRSAMKVVTPEVGLDENGPYRDRVAFMSGPSFSRELIDGGDFGALATSYRLHRGWKRPDGIRKMKQTLPWRAEQVWLMLDDRLFGRVSILSEKNQTAQFVRTRIRVAPYGSTRRSGTGRFDNGSLRIRVREHDFRSVRIDEPAQIGYGEFPPEQLGDALLFERTGGRYEEGERLDLSLEVRAKQSPETRAFNITEEKGLRGFRVRTKGTTYFVVYNRSGKSRQLPIDRNTNDAATLYTADSGEDGKPLKNARRTTIGPDKLVVIRWSS